jgi:glycosyltransferase involved in cell wall biosynthesis
MRVAMIAEHYPPTEGGVATSARRVARSLLAHGIDLRVLSFDSSRPISDPDYLLRQDDCGVDVTRVGPFFVKRPDPPAGDLAEDVRASLRRRAYDQMLRLLTARPVDGILGFHLRNASYLGRWLAAELAVPLVACARGMEASQEVFHAARLAMLDAVLQSAAHVVAVNQHVRRRVLLAFPWAAQRISVIANSVALPATPPRRREARARVAAAAGWELNGLWLVFIGSAREKKGLGYLARAMAGLGEPSPVRLLVIGPEPAQRDHRVFGPDWLRLRAERRIHVTGQVPHAEVAEWSAAGDVVVMPSLDDGMANGLLEGMAVGLCPLVSTVLADTPGATAGIVVPPGDSEALGAALRRLAGDRAAMRRMGRAARALALAYRPEDEAAAYARVLRSSAHGSMAAS